VDHRDQNPDWWTRRVQDRLGPRSNIFLMLVSAVGVDGGEASFPGEDQGRGGEEGVGDRSLDPVPEAVRASEGAGVGS